MARRRRDGETALPGPPTELVVLDEAHWYRPGDEDSELAVDWGPHLARRVLAHHRWSEARQRWAQQHGMSRFPTGVTRASSERRKGR